MSVSVRLFLRGVQPLCIKRLLWRSPQVFAQLKRRYFNQSSQWSAPPADPAVTAANPTVEVSEYPGSQSTFTEDLEFRRPEDLQDIPVYRVMDNQGSILKPDNDPQLDKDTLLKMYRAMTKLDILDHTLSEAQNQGRIQLYVAGSGEEGAGVGSAAALNDNDLVFGQYREAGVLMWRGFTFDQFMNQCYSNCLDGGKGRQIPVHYGSKELRFVTISSPLATQMPQAAGAAYAYKQAKNGLVVMCYFGEGTASEGDAHPAFNFAATLDCPVIFFCRNNGYSTSTPIEEQYRGNGIAVRGPPYGIPCIRVDGNDVLAVYLATKAARHIAITEGRPVLIEAMTYRVAEHHSGVDGKMYRSMEEVSYWKRTNQPITRFRNFIMERGLWTEEEDITWLEASHEKALQALKMADEQLKPNIETVFTDVYDEMPKSLRKQLAAMKQHVAKYRDQYPTQEYQDSELPTN